MGKCNSSRLHHGAVAHLVERIDGIDEARGSIPLGSTMGL